MTRIEKLLKELNDRKVAKQAEIKELIEVQKIELEMEMLDSPLYELRAIEAEDNLKLDAILNHIEELYTQDNRKLSQTFGYGIIPNKVLTICKAIQYSKHDEKQELLMMTGLTEQCIEDLLDAFGNTAYFSPRALEIVPEIPVNISMTKELLNTVIADLGLVGDIRLHKFNKETVEYQSTSARLRAEEALANTLKYATDAEITYTE